LAAVGLESLALDEDWDLRFVLVRGSSAGTVAGLSEITSAVTVVVADGSVLKLEFVVWWFILSSIWEGRGTPRSVEWKRVRKCKKRKGIGSVMVGKECANDKK